MLKTKLVKIIYYILCSSIAIVAVLLIFSAFPIPGNYKVMTVLSGSMEPAIKTGSVIITKPVDNYAVGDIITFGRTTTPTTHRIHEIKEVEGRTSYITKGDANNAPDSYPVLYRDIVGKFLFSIPYVGHAVDAAKKPVGFVLIIVIPALVVVYDEIKKIKQEITRMRNKKRDEEQDKDILDEELNALKKEIEELKKEKNDS